METSSTHSAPTGENDRPVKRFTSEAVTSLQEVALADPERLLQQLSDPAQRRHAAASLHRHGAVYQPGVADRRRAGHFAGRDDPGSGSASAANVGGGKEHFGHPHHAHPGHRPRDDRPGVCDVRGQHRGDGGHEKAFRQSAASLHAGTDQHCPAADGRRHRQRHPGSHPGLSQSAVGLPLSSALLPRHGHLPHGKTAGLSSGRRSRGGLLPLSGQRKRMPKTL